MQDGLMFLFLFVALAVGWLLGLLMGDKKGTGSSKATGSGSLQKHRLQLFFDSYNDESLDRFIESLEVKPDTVALHISIGKHFRTQGEVEKAILIHQNLMSHPELSQDHTDPIVYELAKDYKAAGLFDRSESLLEQLLTSKSYNSKARLLLLDIYEQEKEWQKAYELSNKLDVKKDIKTRVRVAQYCCEIADEYMLEKRSIEASKMYSKALSIDKECIRANLALAEIDLQQENIRQAINRYRAMLDSSQDYIDVILPKLRKCTETSQTQSQYESYLATYYERTKNMRIAIALFELVYERSPQDAFDFLENILRDQPDIQTLYTLLSAAEEGDHPLPNKLWGLFKNTVESLTKSSPAYQCGQCGFTGQHLYWRCPSCRSWQSIKPFEIDLSMRSTHQQGQ